MYEWHELKERAPGIPRRHSFPANVKVLLYYKNEMIVGEFRHEQNKWYYHGAPIYKQSDVTHWAFLPMPPLVAPVFDVRKDIEPEDKPIEKPLGYSRNAVDASMHEAEKKLNAFKCW